MNQKSKPKVVLLWFKRDLRLRDHLPLHRALECASQKRATLLPIFVFEPELYQQPDMAKRHWLFIKDSLIDLKRHLADLKTPLYFHIGSVPRALQSLQDQFDVSDVFAHEETGNGWTYERDKEVAAFLKVQGIGFHEFPTNSVVRRLKSRDDWHVFHRQTISQKPLEVPANALIQQDAMTGLGPFVQASSNSFEEVQDQGFHPDYGTSIQTGGRIQGEKVLKTFLNTRARNYLYTLSSPVDSPTYSSRLSTHITYGNFSTREIHHALNSRINELKGSMDKKDRSLQKGLIAMRQRLHWHCHFIQKLEDEPEIEFQCQHSGFESLRPRPGNPEHLQAWYEGKTGVPIIDAVMRALHQTGWINFRMRAMVSSFASYHLWLDWRETAPLLARLFTDYEPGIHYAQYQMQSGTTGINTFRIYNPYKQSQDQDPEGVFIKRYCPELNHVPIEYLHDPRSLPQDLLSDRFSVPTLYQVPIVDHKTAIKKAREGLSSVMKQEDYREKSKAVYEKHGSRRKARTGGHKPKKAVSRKSSKEKDAAQKNQMTFDF